LPEWSPSARKKSLVPSSQKESFETTEEYYTHFRPPPKKSQQVAKITRNPRSLSHIDYPLSYCWYKRHLLKVVREVRVVQQL